MERFDSLFEKVGFNSFLEECHLGFLKPLFADIEKNDCFEFILTQEVISAIEMTSEQ